VLNTYNGWVLTKETDTQRNDIYKWLEQVNPSALHNIACSNHEDETCLWALRSPEWVDWSSKRVRCLWIHGIPGAGKTVLASFLFNKASEIQENLKRHAAVYYYCYFVNKQDETTSMLKWIISQLCRQVDRIPERVWTLHKSGREPIVDQLLLALEDTLEFFDGIYMVVDALDESLEPRTNLLSVVQKITTDARFEKIQLLVTSREYLDIEIAIKPVSTTMALQNDLIREDIRKYVHSALREQHRFSAWPESLKEEVELALADGAKGMYETTSLPFRIPHSQNLSTVTSLTLMVREIAALFLKKLWFRHLVY
jgi:NACHT domain